MRQQRSTCKKCEGQMTGNHTTYCKDCYNEYKREHYRLNREKEVARVQDYNRRNYDRFLNNLAKYRAGDSYRASRKAWSEKNIEKVRLWGANKNARRRLSIKSTSVRITKEEWDRIKELFGHRCAYCGKKKHLTMDHRTPLSKGGAHSTDNIIPACLSCNMRKNAHDKVQYFQKLGKLI